MDTKKILRDKLSTTGNYIHKLKLELEKSRSLLKDCLPYLRDDCDGYYGEMPVTKLNKDVKDYLK